MGRCLSVLGPVYSIQLDVRLPCRHTVAVRFTVITWPILRQPWASHFLVDPYKLASYCTKEGLYQELWSFTIPATWFHQTPHGWGYLPRAESGVGTSEDGTSQWAVRIRDPASWAALTVLTPLVNSGLLISQLLQCEAVMTEDSYGAGE